MNKVFSNIFIIGIIAAVVLIGAGIGYWWWQNQSVACLTVLTPAKNNKTGECKTFPDSCIPVGWSFNQDCESVSSVQFPPKADLLLAENAPSSTIDASGWQTYRNEKYGFKVGYPFDSSQGEGIDEWYLWLNPGNDKKGFVAVSVGDQPSVRLSNTYGGRYYFNQYPEAPALKDRVLSKEEIINGRSFITDYWIAYGGMGSWDTVINVYIKRNNKYYLLSLVDTFIGGIPGEIRDASGKIMSKEQLVQKAIAAMRDDNNYSVKLFDQILSTFKFIEPE